jgi:hydroxymethylbilane synthase
MGLTIRIGTRGSALAMAQARYVADRLAELGCEVVLRPIRSQGDRSAAPLSAISGKGIFAKEIEVALERGEVDIAVHSLKDLPEPLPPQFALGAVPVRADPRDALVSRRGLKLDALPRGSAVGTSSPRRQAQLLRARPDLEVLPIRGNVDTRLRKLDSGEFDAIVPAAAGLDRLGLSGRITQRLPINRFIPAPGQGALAVEMLAERAKSLGLLRSLDHPQSRSAVTAERALMNAIGAGCRVPFGALATVHGNEMRLRAIMLSPDGRMHVHASLVGMAREPRRLGEKVAQALLRSGGDQLLAESDQQ